MASEVSIVNRALTQLGQPSIGSFDDPGAGARLARDQYAEFRDEVLQTHFWNFALTRANLPELATAPLHGFSRAFALPEDPYCLRVVGIAGDQGELQPNIRFKVEGRKLLCSSTAPLPVLYIARVTDANQMTPLFRAALAMRLAVAWSTSLGGVQKFEDVDYKRALQDAKSADGQEGSPDEFADNEWIEARI